MRLDLICSCAAHFRKAMQRIIEGEEYIIKDTNTLIRGEASCSFILGCRQLTFTSEIDDEIVVESQTVTPSSSLLIRLLTWPPSKHAS